MPAVLNAVIGTWQGCEYGRITQGAEYTPE